MIQLANTRRFAAKVKMPFAVLGIDTNGMALTRLVFLSPAERTQDPTDLVAERAVRELERYLSDPGVRFTVPLAPVGTAFRQRVWNALRGIPRGEARTYGEIARAIASAPRAVGQACGDNPIAVIIPCHRVVGAKGNVGGFMHAEGGDPIAIKRWLLTHEGHRLDA